MSAGRLTPARRMSEANVCRKRRGLASGTAQKVLTVVAGPAPHTQQSPPAPWTTVDGSGKGDGSLQCGADCPATSPALMRSHGCWRHCKVKCANGMSHDRQDGEGLLARMADPTADPDALVPVIIRPPEPPTVADKRPVMAERTQPWQ
jgi:hypothetical protein